MKPAEFLMFGFEGKKAPSFVLDAIKKDQLGGVILFKRNIESESQLRTLTSELQEVAGGKLLIAVDQEGGRVARLARSTIDTPPMRDFGLRYEKSGSTDEVRELGFNIGQVLSRLGFNLDFAPVLDVNTCETNPVIGDRSFGSDPKIVADLGVAFCEGMKKAGVLSCGKHFPGHGDTTVDSHLTLPIVRHDLKRMNEVELVPFEKLIQNDIPSLMSAHVIYEKIDPSYPATLSRAISTGILRDRLGFKGILFSDDIEMKAISDNYSFRDAVVMSLQAGCDILLVCHLEERQREAIATISEAMERGLITEKRLNEAKSRIGDILSSRGILRPCSG